MAKRHIWSYEAYRDALVGNRGEGVLSLRSVARGFDARDGYDLHNFDQWTDYQKRKLRETYHLARELQGQPKKIVRPRSEKNLQRLKDLFHGDVPSKRFKVAFVPHSDAMTSQGLKKTPLRVRFLKHAVSLETPFYKRLYHEFNKRALVKKPVNEVNRVLADLDRDAEEIYNGKVSLFFIQNGDNQFVRQFPRSQIVSQVQHLMNLYDGKKPLPQGSGNAGNDPRYHKWDQWLDGIAGYVLPKGANAHKMTQTIRANRKALQEQKRKERNYWKRKNKRK